MSEQNIPALAQPVGTYQNAALLRCPAVNFLSYHVKSLGASYGTSGLVVTCFDKALFGGIIRCACYTAGKPLVCGGITRFTGLKLFSISSAKRTRHAHCGRALQQWLPSLVDVLLACLRRSSVHGRVGVLSSPLEMLILSQGPASQSRSVVRIASACRMPQGAVTIRCQWAS